MIKPRILIVEDEAFIATDLERIVQRCGCECVAVCSTAECALALIATIKIDAALINLVLHGQPAYNVCAALAVKEIPFAFASGVLPSAVEPLWQKHLYVAKPYSEADVRGVLAKLLAKPEPAIAQVIDDMPPAKAASVSNPEGAG